MPQSRALLFHKDEHIFPDHHIEESQGAPALGAQVSPCLDPSLEV
jgi:hypothetical protein